MTTKEKEIILKDNFLEPTHGKVIDPACGSGGMFVSSGDFIADRGGNANPPFMPSIDKNLKELGL